MDVSLINAINDFYQFDLEVGQEEVRDHLRQALTWMNAARPWRWPN